MGKLLPLESLRGLAALTVVIFHFGVGSHFNNPFTLNGFLLVDFFFVLSGFVIALSYLHRLSNITSLLTFQKKRFWRLYPLHLLMLVVFFGFNLAKYILSDQIQFAKPAFSEDFFLEFLFNLLLLHNWVLPTLTLNVPSWSISAEFFTYLIFGITVLFVKNRTFFLHNLRNFRNYLRIPTFSDGLATRNWRSITLYLRILHRSNHVSYS